jgi:hydroxypyruvate reductase
MPVVRNRDELATTRARELAVDCVAAGIEAAHPHQAVRSSVSLDGDSLIVGGAAYDLSAYSDLLVVGGGKAMGGVATVLADILGDRLSGGVTVTVEPVSIPGVDSVEGGHPVPNEASVAGARRVLELADSADAETLVLAVVTGGGSSLMTAPARGIDLAEIRTVTDAMLDAGMEIQAINAVRKHISGMRGGSLARQAAPATTYALVISDVVGNDPSVVASGPTIPDGSTYADARDTLDRHSIDAPTGVRDRLDAGARGDRPETPDASDPVFERVESHVLADGMTALRAARDVAGDAGYRTLVLSSRLRGEAREAARLHAGIAAECHATGTPVDPSAVLLSGGALTVTVEDAGTGGPDTEFAPASALAFTPPVTVAAVDTDGIDGRADAAGGLVDAEPVTDADATHRALTAHDSATYLRDHAGAIVTGPTGTNVNDLRAVVLTDG